MSGPTARGLTQTALRFGVVGIASVTVHLLLVWLGVEAFGIDPTLVTTAAFLLIAAAAYFLQHHWIFRSELPRAVTSRRFVIVAGAALMVNASTMRYGTAAGLEYLHAQLIAFVLIPISNFIVHAFWTYGGGSSRARPTQGRNESST